MRHFSGGRGGRRGYDFDLLRQRRYDGGVIYSYGSRDLALAAALSSSMPPLYALRITYRTLYMRRASAATLAGSRFRFRSGSAAIAFIDCRQAGSKGHGRRLLLYCDRGQFLEGITGHLL